MRTVFYTFVLRHRSDNTKFTAGPVSRTWGEHANAMKKYKVEGSATYDRVFDFGSTSMKNTFGIREPKSHAKSISHKPKAPANKS